MVGTLTSAFIGILIFVAFACKPTTKIKESTSTISQLPNPTPRPDIQQADGVSLKDQALAILEKNCARCHNLDKAQGGFGTVLDVDEMIKSGRYLIPGDPVTSEVVSRLAPASNMPPSGELAEDERQVLIDWIEGLEDIVIEPLNDFDQLTLIRNDLEQNVAPAQRLTTRYFTLQIPNNAGMAIDTKEFMVKGLSKTLNSLSKTPVITLPTPVDARKLIFRIDLAALALDPVIFDGVIKDFYPYTRDYAVVGNDPKVAKLVNDHEFARQETQTENYLLRMDWFNASATLPVLYARLLQLPPTQQELEIELGVNLFPNIQNNQVIRSGFRNSGVSSQNRVIERHTSTNNLAYWVSYDFADNNENAQNIFNFPIGPAGSGFDAKAFDQDGGEVIFQLPNGMFGYYLSLASGAAIHKGPVNIVRQADGPPQFFQSILNGMSCMSCHGQGLLYKKDDIRGFVSVSQDFSTDEKNKVLSIYATDDQLKAAFDKDNAIHFESLLKMGIRQGDSDPVNQAYLHFNKNLFRKDVQAELGVDEATLNVILNTEPFKSNWVSIFSNSGSITRAEFNLLYGQIVDQFKNGEAWLPPLAGDHLATPACMVADPALMEVCTDPLVEPPPPPAVAQ